MKRNLRIALLIVVPVVLILSLSILAFAEGELKNGSKGDDVKHLQECLISLGYLTGNADGNFGGKTVAAVMKYQDDFYFTTTGTVSETLYKHIENMASNKFDVTPYTEDPAYMLEDEEWSWIGNNSYYVLPMLSGKSFAKYYKDEGTTLATVMMSGKQTLRPNVWINLSYMTQDDFDPVMLAIKIDDTIYMIEADESSLDESENNNGVIKRMLLPMGNDGIKLLRELAMIYRNKEVERIGIILFESNKVFRRLKLDNDGQGAETGFLMDVTKFDDNWDASNGSSFDYSDIDKLYPVKTNKMKSTK